MVKPKLYSDAYSEEEFQALLASWSHISKFQESGSVYVYHKGITLRRHEALCNREDLIAKYFHGNLPVLIDIDTGHLEDPDVLEAEFQKHEKSNKTPIYWICGLDRFLIGKSDSLFHFLRKRQAARSTISYVLFFNINFLHPTVSSILTYTSTFLQNTRIDSLPDEAASRYFLESWVQAWRVNMDESTKRKIVLETKCHFTPLKQAVRYVRDTGSTDIRKILGHDMMHIKMKSIFDGLLPCEQSALLKITIGANDFTSDEAISIKFLKDTGWLEARGHHLYITIPIFGRYVESLQRPAKNIDLTQSHILLGDVPIDSFLSSKERSVLRLLVEKSGTLVDRDDIAKALWGDGWEDVYSDWAIDQLISRLRKKCVDLNISKRAILAVKGKGFLYDKC